MATLRRSLALSALLLLGVPQAAHLQTLEGNGAGSVVLDYSGHIIVGGPSLRSERVVPGSDLLVPRLVTLQLRFEPANATAVGEAGVGWRVRGADSLDAHGSTCVLRLDQPGVVRVELEVRPPLVASAGVSPRSFHQAIVLRVADTPATGVRVRFAARGSDLPAPLDVNGDGTTDDRDLDLLWSSYGCTQGEAGYSRLADWTADGHVGLDDLARYAMAARSVTSGEATAEDPSWIVPTTDPVPPHAFPVEAPTFVATTDPAGFEPWIDWTLDTKGVGSGAVLHEPLREAGAHVLGARWAFGTSAAQDAEHALTLYRARFTELGSSIARIQDGHLYTLHVQTTPPGFEDYVRWGAASLYGAATPASGRGRSFATTFSRTFGGSAREPAARWLGIQAANAYFNLDQTGFANMIWNDAVDTVGDPAGHYYLATLNGTILVGTDGAPDGSATISFTDGSVITFVQQPSGRAFLVTGADTLDLGEPGTLPDSTALFDGTVVDMDTVVSAFQTDIGRCLAPAAMAPTSRALLGLAAIGGSGPWLHNVQVALEMEGGGTTAFKKSFWCKAAVYAASVLAVAAGVAICAACYAGKITFFAEGGFIIPCWQGCVATAFVVVTFIAYLFSIWKS